MKKLLLLLSLPALCLSRPAHAHFNLNAPPATNTETDGGKGLPPCGDNPTPGTATPAQGGHPLAIQIDEFVQHDGFYRFALAINSLSELPLDNVVKDASGNILPPNGMPKGTSASAVFESPAVFPVLADHMFVHTITGTGAVLWQGNITLPNVNCDKCTLQVIEFMAGHQFNTLASGAPAGGYFYHHCATLKITADPSQPLMGAGGGGASSGGASSSGGNASLGGGGGSGGSLISTGGASAGAVGGGGGGGGVAASGGLASTTGGADGAGEVVPAGGAGPTTSGSSGGSPGAAGFAGPASPTSQNEGGCSCSFTHHSGGAKRLAPLLLGLLVVSRRRRRDRARVRLAR